MPVDHPRRKRVRVVAGCAALLLAAAGAGAFAGAGGATDAADAAFASGDHVLALQLYDAALAGDPANTHALTRSAQLLSWRGDYDEALVRYRRVLARDPSNRFAAHEQAKVLSWARRFEEAIVQFRGLVAQDPQDRESRLGLARALSWSGRQLTARREYEALLRDDPNDVDALIGVGQTYAWSGEAPSARTWFERALGIEPAHKDAAIALAYNDLVRGDVKGARRRADDIEQRFPGDRDASALRREIARSRAPWIGYSFDDIADTDANDLAVHRLEGGAWLSATVDLRGGLARHDMTSAGVDASADTLFAALGWRPALGHVITARAGATSANFSNGAHDTWTIGGLAWGWGQGADWSGVLAVGRDPLLYSVPILDAGVTIDSATAAVTGRIPGNWTVSLEGAYWDLSDGNTRPAATAALRRGWPRDRVRWEAGYTFRWFDFSDDLDNGYFDPSSFTAHSLLGRATGSLPVQRMYYDATVEVGLQSFTSEAVRTTNDRVVAVNGLLGFNLGDALALEFVAGWGDFAQQNPAGFESWQFGLRLRGRVE